MVPKKNIPPWGCGS